MDKGFLVATLLAAMTTIAAADVRDNRTESPQTKAVGLIVEYDDGFKEKYLVSYVGSIDIFREQEGEAANTRCWWNGLVPECRVHAVDDRQCRWRFRSYITRQIAMVNRAGEQFPQPELTHVFETSQSGRGEGSNWTRWHEQTCGEAQGNFDQELTGIRNRLGVAFKKESEGDVKSVMVELKGKLRGVRAISFTK